MDRDLIFDGLGEPGDGYREARRRRQSGILAACCFVAALGCSGAASLTGPAPHRAASLAGAHHGQEPGSNNRPTQGGQISSF